MTWNDVSHAQEIAAVVGHELGHWAHAHTLKNMVCFEALALAFFTLADSLMHDLDVYCAFGFDFDSLPPLLVVMTTLMALCEIPMSLMGLGMRVWSRRCEYQADEYASDRRLPLGSALIKIHESNFSPDEFDHWYSLYTNTHPTLSERLARLKKVD